MSDKKRPTLRIERNISRMLANYTALCDLRHFFPLVGNKKARTRRSGRNNSLCTIHYAKWVREGRSKIASPTLVLSLNRRRNQHTNQNDKTSAEAILGNRFFSFIQFANIVTTAIPRAPITLCGFESLCRKEKGGGGGGRQSNESSRSVIDISQKDSSHHQKHRGHNQLTNYLGRPINVVDHT